MANIDSHLVSADIVITGEGKIDRQSVYNKVPVGIGQRAAKFNLPVIAFAGGIESGAEEVYKYGIGAMMSIIKMPMALNEAMERADELIADAAERVMRLIEVGITINNRRRGDTK